MASKSLMDQFVAFAASAHNVSVARDAVSMFFAKIDRQIAFAEEARRGNAVNSRSTWFKSDGKGYRLKIGREPLKFGEHQWFAAATLEEVVERLTMARAVIEASEPLRNQIIAISRARSQRMQGTRRAKQPA